MASPSSRSMAVPLEMLDDSDPARVKRVTAVLLEQKKLDIVALEKAYRG